MNPTPVPELERRLHRAEMIMDLTQFHDLLHACGQAAMAVRNSNAPSLKTSQSPC
jgi:hypothetical protein